MGCLSLLTQVVGATGLLAQHVLASPSAIVHNAPQADGQLLSFIAKERPVALKGILDNIGGSGSKVAGAAAGLVIASPSKADPDCKQTLSQTSRW
jgi:glucoamylase